MNNYFEVDGVLLLKYGEDVPEGYEWRVRPEEPHRGLVEIRKIQDK
jgi:hypothetical protein